MRIDTDGIIEGNADEDTMLQPVDERNRRMRLMWAMEWLRADLDAYYLEDHVNKSVAFAQNVVSQEISRCVEEGDLEGFKWGLF